MEIFVKQRRTRKAYSLEAALYPIIKKFVFKEAELDSLENTYAELKTKKKLVKVVFKWIRNYIIEGGLTENMTRRKTNMNMKL